MRDELIEIKEQFAVPRRSSILDYEINQDIESLIEKEDMVVTLTNTGYIKRTSLNTYRAQKRGGKGRAAMSVKDEDFVVQVFVLNTHDQVLFFTSAGIVHQLKVYKLPEGGPQSKGRPIINLLPLKEDENISTMMPMPKEEEELPDLMFATRSGNVRRNPLSDFSNIQSNGKIAMKLKEGDSLIGVVPCRGNEDIMLSAAEGKCMRFKSHDVRLFKGRGSIGVRGIRLADKDQVISMSVINHTELSMENRTSYLKTSNSNRRGEKDKYIDDNLFDEISAKEQFILTVTKNGFGKRTSAYEYRITNRGGKGIINIETSERNGSVVGSFPVKEEEQIILATDAGRIIRSPVNDIRIASRNTQGVTLFNVNEGESVVSVTKLSLPEEDEQIAGDEPQKDVENLKNNNSNKEIEVAESDQENTDTNNGEES